MEATGSDSVHLATGETYDFDAVDSHRLMLGTRYTREMDKLSKWYAGAALLYEFGGEARAHYQGYSLASPSSAGTSVMLKAAGNTRHRQRRRSSSTSARPAGSASSRD